MNTLQFRYITLFVFSILFQDLEAQQIKLTTEVAWQAIGNRAELSISAISTNDTSYTLDSLDFSFALYDSCVTRTIGSLGDMYNAWSFIFEEYEDTTVTNNYGGRMYNKRYEYFNRTHQWQLQPLVIPDSSQSPILLLLIILRGPCSNILYLESSFENANNQFYDTTGRALSYCVDDLGWYYSGCQVGLSSTQVSPKVSLDYTFGGWGPYSDSIIWEMGDGTTLHNNSYTHTYRYAQPRNYQVCLTAVDTFGCVGRRCVTVGVGLDTPVCKVDSLRHRLQRSFGEKAVSISYYGSKSDSVRYDMGDGTSYWRDGLFPSLPIHHYPRPDTFSVMAIAYSNWYNGIYQCADTAYTSAIAIPPEVRICGQLGPGVTEDSLFFSMENLTDSTLAVNAAGVTVLMDKPCLNATDYHSRLTPFYNEGPFTPQFTVYDTIARIINGTIYTREVIFGQFEYSIGTPRPAQHVYLNAGKDSAFTFVAIGLEGSCKESFYYQETLEEYYKAGGIGYVIVTQFGTSGPIVAITERGCSPTTSSEPLLPGESRFEVWPNPTTDLVLTSLTGAKPGIYHIRVRDALGRELQYWHRPMQDGLAIRLHLGDLPDGLYYVEVQDDAQQLPVMSQPVMVRK
ncbi:MAG: hypothetical protein AB8F95_07640 [Bacteroidia bacterium]